MPLTEEEVEKVAKRASDIVLDSIDGKITEIVLSQIYEDIGRSVVRKALWAIGVLTLLIIGWVAAKFGLKEIG
jgi:hypothetical protein